MLKAELHVGMEVAVKYEDAIDRAIVIEIGSTGPRGPRIHSLTFLTGKYKTATKLIDSRNILCPWEEYKPQWQQEVFKEVALAEERSQQKERLDNLEVTRQTLRMFDIQAGIGNVHVPAIGYMPALFIQYDDAMKLRDVLAQFAADQLKGGEK